MWPIVRQLPMKAGWGDAPLVFRDLAEATHNILQNLQNLLSRHFFSLQPFKPLQRIKKISIGSGEPPHTLFFRLKKDSLSCRYPIPPFPIFPNSSHPKGTCRSNRPCRPSLKDTTKGFNRTIHKIFLILIVIFTAPHPPPPAETSLGDT